MHLLVHERAKKELCDVFATDVERLHFVTDSYVNVWSYRIGKLMPDRLALFTVGAASHFETQIRQRRLAKSLINTCHFDIVHEPIPVSPKLPSAMFGLTVPVVIGPLNGGMDYPPNYNLAGRSERAVVSILRWMSASWNRVLRGKTEAALILVANERTRSALPSSVKHVKCLQLVENGVDLNRFRSDLGKTRHETLDIVYVGRLVDWKRIDLLIEAGGKLIGRMKFQIHIVGDGPVRSSLEKQVQQRCLSDHVRFHGWLSQAMAADMLRNSDVMVLPSMRECGGAVVLEAMASGVPVIAAKWGGPTDYVTEDTGILIPPATPEVFVRQLSDAIFWMAKKPDARAKWAGRSRSRGATLRLACESKGTFENLRRRRRWRKR